MASQRSGKGGEASVTTPEQWDEWHARCALDLCSPPTQAALRGFSGRLFGRFLERYRQRCPGRRMPAVPTDAEAWHLLETHMTVPGVRNGKRYKDWLFARADAGPGDRLDALRGGAGVLLRTAVRRHIAAEGAERNRVSLDAPVDRSGESGALTLADLLPADADPTRPVRNRELEALAAQHADHLIHTLPRRVCVALRAKRAKRSLAHPAVTAEAQCGKSVLREAYRRFLESVFEYLQSRHPNEDRQVLVDLAVCVVEALQQRAQQAAEEGIRIA